ncbi:GNAT family N-acetyltransferase [Halovivax cerinus]|uniref:GNAT family N-acetyltransferase n=1 Tax=Halovivax cerinus TaxID=1487865 RepID=A0ABD5NN11_9EURY|nr:N-acetyltransferase [Halovivax cerinus]
MPRNDRPVIEPATPDDVDVVVECWLRLAAEQREHGSAVSVEENRQAISHLLSAHQSAGGLIVARRPGSDASSETGSIVGFATVTIETQTIAFDETRGLLSNIWVRPDHRGQGIGGELLEAAETALAERGADVCRLEVLEANERARAFYDDHGYETRRRVLERSLDGKDKSDTHSKGDR